MDFRIGQTLGLLVRTLPFIIFRLLIYIGIVIAYVIAAAIGGGIGHLVTPGSDDGGGTFVGALIGFGVVAGILYWIREYVLYLVKAGHIAVLVEVMDGRAPPGGKGQIDYAQEQVRAHFAETSILFGVDQLIKGVLKTITHALTNISEMLPIPGLDVVAGFASRILKLSLTYVDEVILAYNLRTHAENPWAGSRDALILYGQNYKQLLKNALFLAVILWVFTLLVFFVLLAPAVGLGMMLPGAAGLWGFVIALLFAWAIKKAVFEPFAMAALMQVYFKIVKGQTPDAEWDRRLTELSDKFVEMKEKAANYMAPPRKREADVVGTGSSPD